MTTGTFTGLDPDVERSAISQMRMTANSLEAAANSHHCPSDDRSGSHNGCGARLAAMRAEAAALRAQACRREHRVIRLELAAHCGWQVASHTAIVEMLFAQNALDPETAEWNRISEWLPPELQHLNCDYVNNLFDPIGSTDLERGGSFLVQSLVYADRMNADQFGMVFHDSGAVTVIAPGMASFGGQIRSFTHAVGSATYAVPNQYAAAIDRALVEHGVGPDTNLGFVTHSQGSIAFGDLVLEGQYPTRNIDFHAGFGYDEYRQPNFPAGMYNVQFNNTKDIAVDGERPGHGLMNLGYGINHTFTAFTELLSGDVDGARDELRRAGQSFATLAEPTEAGVTVHGSNNRTVNFDGGFEAFGHGLEPYTKALVSGTLGTPEADAALAETGRMAAETGRATPGHFVVIDLPPLAR